VRLSSVVQKTDNGEGYLENLLDPGLGTLELLLLVLQHRELVDGGGGLLWVAARRGEPAARPLGAVELGDSVHGEEGPRC